jgi:hypothetical protein
MSQPATPHLLDDVLKFVEVSSFGMKRAMDEIDVHRTQQKKAADLQPALLDKLLAMGLVAGHQKQAAAAMLGSHAETLNLFNALAEKYASLHTQKAAKDGLGNGVDPKTAGVAPTQPDNDSTTSPWVGRHTGEKKASDLAILAVLDTPPGR